MGNRYENLVMNMLIEKRDTWYGGYRDVVFDFKKQAACRYKNGGHGVVDLSAHVYTLRKRGGGSWFNFEIKSGKRDLFSDKGLNLFSMYNYLVYPRSQITMLPDVLTYENVEQRLHDIGCDHAGIIAVLSDTELAVERQAHRYYGDGMPPYIRGHIFKTK